MPAFLTNIGAALGTYALKWGLGLMLLLSVGSGGYILGETRAARLITETVLKDANARVAAAQKSDEASLADYLTRLSSEAARGDALSAALAKDEAKLATDTRSSEEAISHAIPVNTTCDLPAAALGVLRAQPARH